MELYAQFERSRREFLMISNLIEVRKDSSRTLTHKHTHKHTHIHLNLLQYISQINEDQVICFQFFSNLIDLKHESKTFYYLEKFIKSQK